MHFTVFELRIACTLAVIIYKYLTLNSVPLLSLHGKKMSCQARVIVITDIACKQAVNFKITLFRIQSLIFTKIECLTKSSSSLVLGKTQMLTN